MNFRPRNKWCKGKYLRLSTKGPQSRALENTGPERTLLGYLTAVLVESPTRITLENNGKIRPQPDREKRFLRASGGEGGIRTHGGLAPTTVFETAPIGHSGTSPQWRGCSGGGALVQEAKSRAAVQRIRETIELYRFYFKTRKFSWVMTRKLSDTSWIQV